MLTRPDAQKIEEMRITIEDLEALKELNDELEENHVETEKAMQEEIGKLALRVVLRIFLPRACRGERDPDPGTGH